MRIVWLLAVLLCFTQTSNASNNAGQSMKTIGLLGGTGWSSTINYYTLLNELVHQKLGGFHSARVLLKSIDYHDIMSNYGTDNDKVAQTLQHELEGLMALKPDCILICCNSLHKYYDLIKHNLDSSIPVFHAAELVGQQLKQEGRNNVLLLATKTTMEDGFFANILQTYGINVTIPTQQQRDEMQKILANELLQNIITEKSKAYFADLIKEHSNLDAVVLGCTEFPLLVNQENSVLPVVDPVHLQTTYAVNFALNQCD